MIKVYGMTASGNCYKVRMILELLHKKYEWREIDVAGGGTRSAEFLAMNPAGQVPVLEITPGRYLTESNAILFYLAEDSPLWPQSRYERAHVLSWMFFEQYSHEPYIAVARSVQRFLPPQHPRRAELPTLVEKGHKALQLMENHLQDNAYFTGLNFSIADIALYAYTHCAGEGGFDLVPYPALRQWLQRIEAKPGYVPMTAK